MAYNSITVQGRMLDLTGRVYGKLTVKSPYKRIEKRGVFWLCSCSCGNTTFVRTAMLQNGNTTSCGCNRGKSSITHGKTNTPEYRIWSHIKGRCNNPTDCNYGRYGGRGISVSPEWGNSFETFLKDMGKRPSSTYTIDRIDNSVGYSKENCRWTTRLEQARNTRRNVILDFNGKSLCVSEWADIVGAKPGTLSARLRAGWSVEKTLTHPIGQSRR